MVTAAPLWRRIFRRTQRQRARDAHEAWLRAYTRRVKARYDNAGTNPEMERYWSQADLKSPTSANDYSVRLRLRSRSRYECQENNSFAAGMLQTKVNDVIGTGPMLRPETPDRETNVAIRERWQNWAKSINLSRKLRLIESAKIADGEGFCQRSQNPNSRDEVPLDLLVTEADLWTDPWQQIETPNFVDGIAYNEFGYPVSYTRLLQHPGDTTQLTATDTVEVGADDVIHWFRESRPGQRRGVPDFTAALNLFADLRRYRLAVLAAAEIAADYAGVMYTDSPAFNDDELALAEEFMTIDLERRAMVTLPAGYKLQQLKAEQPTTQFDAFTESILAEIGRVLQMPLNLVSGTSRQYNFASGRLDYLLYWQHCDVERHDFECQVMDRVFRWWLDQALLVPGYLPSGVGNMVPHRWVWPSRRPIDEVKAAQADRIRFDMGHLSDQQWADREQVDLISHYEALAEMNEARTLIGAPLPGGATAGMSDDEDEETDQAATENAAAA